MPWALISLGAMVAVAATAWFVVRNWPSPPIAPSLPILVGAGLLYTMGDFLSVLLAHDTLGNWVGVVALYSGLMALGPAWLIVSLRFAELHGEKLPVARSRWIWAPAWLAFATWLALLTNPLHGQFLTLTDGRNAYHALWYAHTVVAYVTVGCACAVFLRLWRGAAEATTRAQARWLLLATTLAFGANLLYVVPDDPLPFDTTTVGIAGGCVLLVAGIYRRRMYALSVVSLSGMIEQDSDALMMVDREGRLVHANAATHRLLGDLSVAPGTDAVSQLSAVLRRPGSDRPITSEALRERLLGDRQGVGELFRLGTREPRWLRFETTPIRDGKGRTTGFVLRARDETELRRATEAEAEHAATLEAVFAATGEGVIVCDLDQTVRFTNRRYREIFGLEDVRAGMAEVDLLRTILPQVIDRARFLSVTEAIGEDRTVHIHDQFGMTDGRIIERVSLPLYRDGGVAGRVWQLRDVTEERRSEDALRNAQKLESLGLMAGGIAHDFNNLLVAVLGNADIALDGLAEESDLRGLLGDIRTAAERGSELTRQLLAYAGRPSGTEEQLDLSAIVGDMLELLSVSVPRRVVVERLLPKDLPAIRADGSQIQQVVMNLVINAADAIGDREGSLRVETGPAVLDAGDLEGALFAAGAKPGPTTWVRVTDDGCGMDAATRTRIFDPFFTTKATGRGLGLAATLGIVKAYGGVVFLESEPGRGSSFSVHFPADAKAKAPPPVLEEPAVPLQGRGRVLLADDEAPVRRVARRLLEGMGFEVTEAADGVEALEAWRRQGGDFRLALLDMTMPRMGGDEALARLRALDPKLPVVLSSGFTTDEPHLQEQASPTTFLPKPYRRSALVRALRDVLGDD